MQILRYSKNIILPEKKRYLALGVFDGVHLGHQKLIKLSAENAKKNDGISIVATFDPHPDTVIHPESNLSLLTTLEERVNLIRKYDIDIFLIFEFNEKISKMSPESFITDILINSLQIEELFVGFDYKFGFQGKGNTAFLKKYAESSKFKTNILKPVVLDNTLISSTIIKNYISLGEIGKARTLLGHDITISGKVIPGKGRGGKLLDFATANIETPAGKIIPANGVYLVEIEVEDEKYYGLMNIGFKPTFNEKSITLEVHIINFSNDIYNKSVSISLLQKIRNEKCFRHPDLLKKQIEEDILTARKMISNM